jgi:hypothetical protein
VALMGLRYVVITSVDRDDLADGGAAHYAACIRAIKARNPQTAVEALTPDFSGSEAAVNEVVSAGLRLRPEPGDRTPPDPPGQRSKSRLPADAGRAGHGQAGETRDPHQIEPHARPRRNR